MNQFAALDIETTDLIRGDKMPEITAVCLKYGNAVLEMYNGGKPIPVQGELDILATYLHETQKDYTIVTWNGAGFDFPVLAHHIPEGRHLLKEICRSHLDLFLLPYCLKGKKVGQRHAARGMGFGQSPEFGTTSQLERCRKDVEILKQIAEKSVSDGGISWKYSRGGNHYCFWTPGTVPNVGYMYEGYGLPSSADWLWEVDGD